MATPHDARDLATTIARQRMLVRVRWLAALFGIGQILAYEMQEYPAGVREAALVTIVLFVAGNVALSVGAGRATTTAEARRLAVASLVLDGAVASAFTYLYAFDPVSAMFALLFLVPIEGAVHFQLRGAMWSWGGVGVLYVGRELYAVQFDNPFEWTSLTFRVGLLGLVALTVGLITRQLARESARSQQALAELQRIELWRTRLLGMLGHDLRSPLTAVQGLATIVAADAERLGPAEVRDLTQRIVTQSNRLLALAEDLLELARQEQDSLVLQRQRVALRPLAREAAESAGYADGTHLDLPEELVADVDPARFAQVLGNLIANGHRHGAPPVRGRGR